MNFLIFFVIATVKALTKFPIPGNYNHLEPPCMPTKIMCIFSLYQVKEVDDLKRFVTLDIGLYLNWSDPRLIDPESDLIYRYLINNIFFFKKKSKFLSIFRDEQLQNYVDDESWDKIWKPDLFFYHNREIELVKTYDIDPVAMEIYPGSGEVSG